MGHRSIPSIDPIESARWSCAKVLAAGGFRTGGFNFDAKLRRQSIDPIDLVHAHVGGIDVPSGAPAPDRRWHARGRESALTAAVEERYAGWDAPLGKDILAGRTSLAQLSERVLSQRVEPGSASLAGRQEALENLVSRYLK